MKSKEVVELVDIHYNLVRIKALTRQNQFIYYLPLTVIGIKYGYAFDLLFSNSIAICKNQSQFDSIQEVPCYHISIYNSYDYFCMIGLFDYFCMITLILILSFCKIHLFISEYFDISPGLRALTDVAAVSGPKRQVVSTSVLSQLHEG